MNIIKKTLLTFFIGTLITTSSHIAFAGEAATSSAKSIEETITHIEKALTEVNKSDFAAAQVHLKAARETSDQITGHEIMVKQGNGSVIQGMIQARKGDVAKSAEELTKALGFYKSL
ncbi:MAG: hypothetical protein PHY16_08660 [Methylobacter sp.]|nr:hypothetical protein [Methylobacter sp.]